MATTLKFKDVIDLNRWRSESPAIAASGVGMTMCSDPTNASYRSPYIYLLRSAIAMDQYNTRTGEWIPLPSPALSGTFGLGTLAMYHATQGIRGTLAAGATTTTVTPSATVGATLGLNVLANNGTGKGFRIRIIGLAAGKIEERNIIASTSSTTPLITLDVPLSFTPATSDKYEILNGRVYLLNTNTATTTASFRWYDPVLNTYTSMGSTTGFPAAIGVESAGFALSENMVPSDTTPGAGLIPGGATYNAAATISCIQATASTNTTNAVITGSGMPASLTTNEYANAFQIRIVEDSGTAAAVGQRKTITSHTSGATGAFTLNGTWTTAPSSSAKFVVEYDDNVVLFLTNSLTAIAVYSISGNSWSANWGSGVATPAATARAAGSFAFVGHGVPRDTTATHKHSMTYWLRGGASASIDVLDMSANAWTTTAAYLGSSQTFTTGTCGVYDPLTLGGRFCYINTNGTNRVQRFDIRNRVMEGYAYMPFTQGTAITGNKMALGCMFDGAAKLSFSYLLTQAQTQMLSIPNVDAPNQTGIVSSTITAFTSTSSATLAAFNPAARKVTIQNEGAGTLYLLYGSGTASTTNYNTFLFPNEAGEFTDIVNISQITGIFGSAGTARVGVML